MVDKVVVTAVREEGGGVTRTHIETLRKAGTHVEKQYLPLWARSISREPTGTQVVLAGRRPVFVSPNTSGALPDTVHVGIGTTRAVVLAGKTARFSRHDSSDSVIIAPDRGERRIWGRGHTTGPSTE